MSREATPLARSLAKQRDRACTNLTFEQLQAKFPTEDKFGIQTSKVEKSIDSNGAISRMQALGLAAYIGEHYTKMN